MLEQARAGRHALLVAPTGAGKTLAGFLPTLTELIERPAEGLHTLYVSPLKALAVDVQRNLLTPIEEMGLDIRVETRTGDTPSRPQGAPARPAAADPADHARIAVAAAQLSRQLHDVRRAASTIVIDEVHAFATGKRGDLLSLCMARLQRIAPDAAPRRAVGDGRRSRRLSRLARARRRHRHGQRWSQGEPGADPNIAILLPEGRVPWAGHSGRYAAEQVMAEIETHTHHDRLLQHAQPRRTDLPGSVEGERDSRCRSASITAASRREARRKVERAMADGRLRALVATASLDLGVDWGDVDCVIQMGAPKGSSRLLQRIGRANHRLDEPSEAILVPGNRFEYLEARAALDAVEAGELDPDIFRPGALDVLAQHVMACACAAPFDAAELLHEIRCSIALFGARPTTVRPRARASSATAAMRCAPMTVQAPDPGAGRPVARQPTPASSRSTG